MRRERAHAADPAAVREHLERRRDPANRTPICSRGTRSPPSSGSGTIRTRAARGRRCSPTVPGTVDPPPPRRVVAGPCVHGAVAGGEAPPPRSSATGRDGVGNGWGSWEGRRPGGAASIARLIYTGPAREGENAGAGYYWAMTATATPPPVTAQEARDVAEAARETEWTPRASSPSCSMAGS